MKTQIERTTINLENDKYFINLVRSGYLEVYRKGKIKNNKTGKFLGSKNKSGYYSIGHKVKGTKKVRHILIHRLVFIVHKNNMKPAPFIINHKDGVKTNNRINNLEKSTYSKNNKHAFDRGLSKVSLKTIALLRSFVGEKANSSKLTDRQSREIRRLYSTGYFSQRDLAKQYNVHHCTVNQIVNYKSYKVRPIFYFAPSLVKERRLDREKYG